VMPAWVYALRRPVLPAPLAHRREEFLALAESGEPPRLFGIEPPKPRIAAVRVVDMTGSNSWAEFATVFCNP
jgi:hypothetical protein